MSKQYVVAASEDTVYLWQYRSSLSPLASDSTAAALRGHTEERELIWHIDSGPPPESKREESSSFATYHKHDMGTSDAICCTALSDKYLVRVIA